MPHVAILIPAAGERSLANLARDAIAKFTQDVSHEVHVLDHRRGKPWPESGSEANALSLKLMLLGISPFATHVWAMHDDALPIRAGWLAYLLSKPGPVVGVKISQRSGMAHPSGVLWTRDFALANLAKMDPELPARDVGEFPASWCAEWTSHRPGLIERVLGRGPVTTTALTPWWWPFDCDVSSETKDYAATALYVHAGGGTIGAGRENDRQRRTRVAEWIGAARRRLGL